MEINEIFKDDVLISHTLEIYNLLEGDNILDTEINKHKNKKKKNEEIIKEELL